MTLNRFVWSVIGFGFSIHLAFANGPCAADREKFCKGIEPGEGRIMKCLKEHEAELSAECKARGEKAKQHFKEARKACKQDVQTHCSGTEKGHGRVMKCLKENMSKLSEGCQAEFKKK